MAKVNYIKCGVYKRGVHVLIGTHNELLKYIKKEYKGVEKDYKDFLESVKIKTNGYATTYWGDGECVVLLPKFPDNPEDIAVATHEMMHATECILWYSGIYKDKEKINDEVFAYLLEYLVKNTLEEENYEDIK